MVRPEHDHAFDENLAKLLERIVPALAPEAVYLFGSRAGGASRRDSDYDLLVVVPDDTPREKILAFQHLSPDARHRRSRRCHRLSSPLVRAEPRPGRYAQLQGHPRRGPGSWRLRRPFGCESPRSNPWSDAADQNFQLRVGVHGS